MCNSHASIQTFNLSPPLSDQHFDTHTSHNGDDQNAGNRRQSKSAITVKKSSLLKKQQQQKKKNKEKRGKKVYFQPLQEVG